MVALAQRLEHLRHSGILERGTAVVGLAGLSLAVGAAAAQESYARAALAASILLLLFAIGMLAPRPLLFGLVIWLALVGMTRRLLTEIIPQGPADPLLLVGPVAFITLTIVAYERGAFRSRTRLSQIVAAFTALVVLGALNPLQGSPAAGLAGLIFFVPLLAFWVGRAFCDDETLTKILVLVGVLAIPAAAYGLLQTFVGFPSWDQRWIDSVELVSLQVSGAIRPFASFSSGAEFGTFLAVGIVVWVGLTSRRLILPLTAAVVAFLSVGVFYQSSRGTIVMILLATGLMLGARRRLSFPVSALIGLALLAALPFVVETVAPPDAERSSLVSHQVEGLANPLDPESSTAGIHLELMWIGIRSAFTEPFGHGIGSVTRAGAKFGGLTAGTETDPSNAAVALGLLGLIGYVLLLLVGFSRVYRLARGGQPLAVAALGVVSVMLFQWLNGGQYAVAFLPWLIFGWADRKHALASEE